MGITVFNPHIIGLALGLSAGAVATIKETDSEFQGCSVAVDVWGEEGQVRRTVRHFLEA